MNDGKSHRLRERLEAVYQLKTPPMYKMLAANRTSDYIYK